MAPRATALVLLAIMAGTLLAGCTERLQGVGTFRVVLAVSDEDTAAIGSRTYVNRLENFSAAPAHIVSVAVTRGDQDLRIDPSRPDRAYDLVALAGSEVTIFEKKVVRGLISEVAVTILPFNATLTNGQSAFVNTSFSQGGLPYYFPKNATVDLAGDTTFVVRFLLTEGKVGGRSEYFLLARQPGSGPR